MSVGDRGRVVHPAGRDTFGRVLVEFNPEDVLVWEVGKNATEDEEFDDENVLYTRIDHLAGWLDREGGEAGKDDPESLLKASLPPLQHWVCAGDIAKSSQVCNRLHHRLLCSDRGALVGPPSLHLHVLNECSDDEDDDDDGDGDGVSSGRGGASGVGSANGSNYWAEAALAWSLVRKGSPSIRNSPRATNALHSIEDSSRENSDREVARALLGVTGCQCDACRAGRDREKLMRAAKRETR
jgi:hypothetical protein